MKSVNYCNSSEKSVALTFTQGSVWCTDYGTVFHRTWKRWTYRTI